MALFASSSLTRLTATFTVQHSERVQSNGSKPPRVRPHVARVLNQTRAVLLSSSALCELLDPGQAPDIAKTIRDRILARGHRMSIIAHVNQDPLAMLGYAHSLSPADGADAEQVLRTAELSAAATATIAPDARRVIEACRETGRSVAVMSVHCTEAVETVLGQSELRPWTGPVIGRDHIKATTWDFYTITDLVRATAQAVGEEPANCAVVGLSPSAMFAAEQIGAFGIGVVNQHANRKHLSGPETVVVVPSLSALASALTTVHPTT